jgi:hypothetical protein
MTIFFRTQNSTYEVDRENKRIRRTEGVGDPTDRFTRVQDEDGWTEYASIEVVSMFGETEPSLVIEWPGFESPTHTVTSRLVPVTPENVSGFSENQIWWGWA